MDPRGFKGAERARRRAQESLVRLIEVSSRDVIQDAWEDFLNATSRFYEKLKAASLDDPRSKGWFDRVSNRRRDDPLSSYMLHARNADHHRFEDVATIEPGGALFTWSGGTGEINLEFENGHIVSYEAVPFETTPDAIVKARNVANQLTPRPVTDRTVTYLVPREHRGQPIRPATLDMFARLTLEEIDRTLEEARPFLPR